MAIGRVEAQGGGMVTTAPLTSADLTIAPLDLDDASQVAAWTALENAAIRADAPWLHPRTPATVEGALRYAWDLEPPSPYLVRDHGAVVAFGTYGTSEYDNQHLAWLEVKVHPDHRRHGIGSAMWEVLLDRAREEGRTSVGTDGWDAEGPLAFARRHGLERKLAGIMRRQDLTVLDRGLLDLLYAEARPAAAAYELVRYPSPTPEDDLADVAVMVSAINDAPTDDLDIEDEEFPPERIRAYETAQASRGITLHRIVARHRETGELAGQTVMAVDRAQPWHAEQHDTSVVAAHRGHRLGLLLKIQMLLLLLQEEPRVRTVDTWNAESNDHMIAVNELLGYRVLGRVYDFQRSI